MLLKERARAPEFSFQVYKATPEILAKKISEAIRAYMYELTLEANAE